METLAKRESMRMTPQWVTLRQSILTQAIQLTDKLSFDFRVVLAGAIMVSNFRNALQKGDTAAIMCTGAPLIRKMFELYRDQLGDELVKEYGSLAGARIAIKQGDEAAVQSVAQYDEASPDSSQHLGLIAQRMPSLTYKAAEFDDKRFDVTDFDVYVMQAANQDGWRRFA